DARLRLDRLLIAEAEWVIAIALDHHAVVWIARARHECADQRDRQQFACDGIARAAVGSRASQARRDRDGASRLVKLRRFRPIVALKRESRGVLGVLIPLIIPAEAYAEFKAQPARRFPRILNKEVEEALAAFATGPRV